MANPFVNFLSGVVDGSGDMRDYQHASRLYVNNFYEFAPKAGWIYYTVLNINPKIREAITNAPRRAKFDAWLTRTKGVVGLLAKTIELPKFTIATETLNQYNRKVIIQKQITYSPVSVTFHDDMSNATTDLWKHYYQYYFADSIDEKSLRVPASILPKYTDRKYAEYSASADQSYGLNNKQTVPFFISIDIYQLHKQHYTSFKLVNPMIKEWAHDQLDQTQGGRLLASRMSVDYETVIYNTDAANKVTRQNPGFTANHYDNTPSPLSIGGNGNNSLFGDNGLIAGAGSVFGELSSINGDSSPLDILNTAIKGANLVKNAKNISAASLKAEGYSMLNGTLANIASTPASITNLDGTVSKVSSSDRLSQGISASVSGITNILAPAGINLFTGNNSSTNNTTPATPKKLGG